MQCRALESFPGHTSAPLPCSVPSITREKSKIFVCLPSAAKFFPVQELKVEVGRAVGAAGNAQYDSTELSFSGLSSKGLVLALYIFHRKKLLAKDGKLWFLQVAD